MEQQRTVLFWLFVSFFLIIGVVSLLAVVGVLRTDPRFRRWAVTGFVAGVTGAVIGLFRITFTQDVDLVVTLVPPQEVRIETLDLVGGRYEYDEPTKSGDVKTHSGRVEVVLGEGVWQATLPQGVLDKGVELKFEDRNRNWWSVRRFYPNHNTKHLVKSAAPKQPSAGLLFQRTPVGDAFAAAPEPALAEQEPRPSPSLTAKKEGPLKFSNYARPSGSLHGRTSYKWRVFLDEPRSVLDTIAEVEYLLHPTFPEPLQVRTDPRKKFALEASGWGQFTILITIRYKDGRVAKTSYYLDLSKGWPAG